MWNNWNRLRVYFEHPGGFGRHAGYERLVTAKVMAMITVMALLLTGVTGCATVSQKGEEPEKRDIYAMDTFMSFTAYGENASEALDAAEEEIRRLDQMLSTGSPTSEISRLNRNGEADVSEDTAVLIERSKALWKDTGGVFDITVYPLMKAWGFDTREYRIPEKEEIARLRSLMGADKIRLDKGHVSFAEKGVEIDLGGIAKGYASGRLMDIFKKNGIESALVSLGGNVDSLGGKPDGSAWKVAVKDPANLSSYCGVLSVKDRAVITSGDYERYFEEGGRIYHHIIDPATGFPADKGMASVTIVSEDSTLADGLSTALFIMGRQGAEEYWRAHSRDFDMILVEKDGTITVSGGIADAFTSDREYKTLMIDGK